MSRANGSVELLLQSSSSSSTTHQGGGQQQQQLLRTVATMAGARDKPIHLMTWVTVQVVEVVSGTGTGTSRPPHLRLPILVGASRDGSIFVVDFFTTAAGRQLLVAVTPSGGGGIFALSALVVVTEGQRRCGGGPVVAAGCEDGAIRFFRVVVATGDDDDDDDADKAISLQLVSTIPSTGAAVLSLQWIRYSSSDDDYQTTKPRRRRKTTTTSSPFIGTTVFAGVADGTIRRYDYYNETEDDDKNHNHHHYWKPTLRMTVECRGRTTPTRVWALRALRDGGTVVSGDSLGHVQFWDGHLGTLLATFDQNENKADVLCMAVSRNQCKVFASGIDSRVVCIERAATSTDNSNNKNNNTWVLTSAQRPHTHDVQAMAIFAKKKSGSEILCTGGVDTKLCTYSVADFSRQRPYTLYPWPCHSPVKIATQARILAMTRDDRVDLYELAPPSSSSSSNDNYRATASAPILVNTDNLLIGSVQIQSPHNLVAATISKDGRFLAVCNAVTTLVFALDYYSATDSSSRRTVTPTRISLQLPPQRHVVAMKFVRNDRLVLACTCGSIEVIGLSESGESGLVVAKVRQTMATDQPKTPNKKMLPISTIACSLDGAWFATSRNITAEGAVEVFWFDGHEYRRWWRVPDLDVPHTTVSFFPSDKGSNHQKTKMVVACVNYAAYIFDLEHRRLSHWSASAGFPVSSSSIPADLLQRGDFPVHIAINPSKKDQFFLVRSWCHNIGMCCVLTVKNGKRKDSSGCFGVAQ